MGRGGGQATDAIDLAFATAARLTALEKDVVPGSSTASSQQLLHALKEPLRICGRIASWEAEVYTLSQRSQLVTSGAFHTCTVFVEAANPVIRYALVRNTNILERTPTWRPPRRKKQKQKQGRSSAPPLGNGHNPTSWAITDSEEEPPSERSGSSSEEEPAPWAITDSEEEPPSEQVSDAVSPPHSDESPRLLTTPEQTSDEEQFEESEEEREAFEDEESEAFEERESEEERESFEDE